MRLLFILSLLCLALPLAAAESAGDRGTLETTRFRSALLGRDVALNVWLPADYSRSADTQQKYAVMYLLDGSAAFAASAKQGKPSLQLEAALDQLIRDKKIEPVIVVAVEENPQSDSRRMEYIPYRDLLRSPDGFEPNGKHLPQFLVAEVMPRIAAAYRVSGDPRKVGIGGFSYGAVAALEVLLQRPELFQLAILESPSLQVGNGQVLRDTANLVASGRRIAIGMGTREAGPNEGQRLKGYNVGELNAGLVRSVKLLADNLRGAAVPAEVQLVVEEGAEHNVTAWARRLPNDLLFLFAPEAGK